MVIRSYEAKKDGFPTIYPEVTFEFINLNIFVDIKAFFKNGNTFLFKKMLIVELATGDFRNLLEKTIYGTSFFKIALS